MLNKIAKAIFKNPILILTLTILIIATMIFGVLEVGMSTGNDTLIDPSTQEYIDNYNYQEEFGSDPIIIIYEGENTESLLTVENLSGLKNLHLQLNAYEEVFLVNSPASLLPAIPQEQYMLDANIYDEFGNLKPAFSQFIINDYYMRVVVVLEGEVPDSITTDIITTIDDFLEAEGLTESTLVSGKPVLDLSIKTAMMSSMQQMILLSAIIMIFVLYLVFKVKWRLLPLAIILIALVSTVGIMGWLNIGITMVSMAVFPILIGLGIDYLIQFQTRYTEEIEGGDYNE